MYEIYGEVKEAKEGIEEFKESIKSDSRGKGEDEVESDRGKEKRPPLVRQKTYRNLIHESQLIRQTSCRNLMRRQSLTGDGVIKSHDESMDRTKRASPTEIEKKTPK